MISILNVIINNIASRIIVIKLNEVLMTVKLSK